ncbi:PTS sugar transporter subunit IIC [Nicoliella lavandulae]|uniref:PTS sugar transporter subunit IIC n=1 Tax=Nicoliella lavandulae TaxID=3082954 RepID=A0ABU8SJB5_9LACO
MNINAKQFKAGALNVLNGVSIAIIVALMPSALLNEVLDYGQQMWPVLGILKSLVTFAMGLLPVIAGLCVAMYFKFKPMETATLALTAAMGAGNWTLVPTGGFIVKGSGDVINVMVTIAVAVILIKLLAPRLGNYSVLLLPTLTIAIGGGIGLLTLGPVRLITKAIGDIASWATALQPEMMGIAMGILFAVLILSPISSVGVATAISLGGVASGSANLGITAAAIALAVYGSQVNAFGTCIAHFIGMPKIQMANVMQKPKLFIPIAINACIVGGIGALLRVQGTPLSAGFGSAGLVGPINALKTGSNVFTLLLIYLVVPLILAFISKWFFMHKTQFMAAKDFYLNYD